MKNVTDYIRIYKKALSVNFCKALILASNINKDDWEDARAMKGRNKYRSAKFFTKIDREHKTKKGNLFNFDSIIHTVVGNLLKLYGDKVSGLYLTHDEGYQLLRYSVGDFHVEHVDDCLHSKQRTVSLLFMCNDDFKGGDLKFMGKHIIKMGVGDAIIFPSNFMFPHQVSKITAGNRYVISTFCNSGQGEIQ